MKYIIALSALLALIVACHTVSTKNFVIGTPDDYKGKQYSVQVDRDTTLLTANGALLKIPKGTLSVENGNTANLEIKEAYSIEQMISAGLYTTTNGEPLSSGGMIYINPVEGQNIKINKPIQVAIPTNYLNKEMQLYKGDKDANGDINWNNPVALPENQQQKSQDNGQTLFQSKCASCHKIGQDGVAPSLAHILKRFDPETSHHYLFHYGQLKKGDMLEGRQESYSLREHNPELFTYKCNLSAKYGGLTGPDYKPDYSINEEIKDTTRESQGTSYLLDIFNYIQRESDRLALALPWQDTLKKCVDSCRLYREATKNILELKSMSEAKKKKLIEENGSLVIQNDTRTGPINTNATPVPNFDDMVKPENYRSVYYQFTIESFGWFNVDQLMKGSNGNVESELFVSIVGEYKEKVKVYLIIPSIKVYTPGGFTSDKEEEYAFAQKNGKIFLPQNAEAYILAVTETEDGIAYGLTKFTTSTQQRIELSLKKSNKQEFESAIKSLNLTDIKVTVDESKNADEIRKIVTDIKTSEEQLKKAELLKPKNCDCDCEQRKAIVPTDSTAAVIVRIDY